MNTQNLFVNSRLMRSLDSQTVRQLVFCILLALFLPQSAYSQKAIFLAIQGDGTASVVIDPKRHFAWITDGGRKGPSGIAGATIGGVSVLEYLRGEKIASIAITCSHPHADHMGGLLTVLSDPLIRSFKLHFVDNGIPAKDRLYQTYEKFVGKEFAKANATYKSAEGVNAFAELGSGTTGDVSVSNFAYNPKDVGNDEHDTSVIMQYEIKGAPSRTVVDFDDASSALVSKWVDGGGKANAIVYPHHGSKNNSIDGILAKRTEIGLQDVVITVNRQNRFLHPSSQKLVELLAVVKPEHIFITDSDLGDNVEVDVVGAHDAAPRGSHIQRLRDFIDARIDMHTAAIRKLVTESPDYLDPALDGDAVEHTATDNQTEQLLSKSGLSKRKANAVRRNIAAVRNYRKAMAMLTQSEDKDSKTFMAGLLKGGDFDPPASPNGAPDPHPSEPPDAGGSYLDQAANSSKAQHSHAPSGSGSVAFEEEATRKRPTWGGIVFGNKVSGPEPEKLSFSEIPEPGFGSLLAIHVVVKGGQEGDYLDATGAELWAAYNFVVPSAMLKAQYPGKALTGNMAGLVGLVGSTTSKVALHPALVNTQVGWDAIMADNILLNSHAFSNAHKDVVLSPVMRDGKWLGYENYSISQWNDVPTQVIVQNGRVSVTPAETGRSDCVLRLRLARFSDSVEWRNFTDLIDAQMRGRADSLGKSEILERVNGLVNSQEASADLDKMQKKQPTVPRTALKRMLVWNILVSEKWVSQAELKTWWSAAATQSEKGDAGWQSEPMLREDTYRLCIGYRPLVEMDHLARLIALLNWFSGFGTRTLPPLPPFAQPVWHTTPAILHSAQLLYVGGHQYTQ